MKREIIFLALILIFVSSVSAEVIFTIQPDSVYNLGEIITVPITIKSTQAVAGVLDGNLICNGQEINFYKNGITLSAGQEEKLEPSLVLKKSLIGELTGECIIKISLEGEYALTNAFKVSSLIDIKESLVAQEISPGETLTITGTANKESGAVVDGFIRAEILPFNSFALDPAILSQISTINQGKFAAEISTQDNMPAGTYRLRITAYERDSSGEATNKGIKELVFSVKQIPTNIEIILENKSVNPGSQVKISAILYDQTGVSIPFQIDVEIKNSKGKVVERAQIESGDSIDFITKSNEPPAGFVVSAVYGEIKNQNSFEINSKEDIKIQVSNETLILTNTGNVPYCEKTVLVKIGDEPLNIVPCLDVDESQKYSLSAPNGEYPIEVIANNQKISGSAVLTGSAVNIKEISNAVLSRKPFIWIFVVLIFGLMVFSVYKKGYKRSFVGGYVEVKKKSPTTASTSLVQKPVQKSYSQQNSQRETPSRMALSSLEYAPRSYKPLPKQTQVAQNTQQKFPSEGIKRVPSESFLSHITTSNISRGQLILSIQGESQNASVICLKIRNYNEAKAIGSVRETLSKAIEMGKSAKAIIYENQENTFFILAPIKTKTIKNDKEGIALAQKIKDVLNYHNRIQRQRMDFGVSVSTGNIIVKLNRDIFEFAPLGDTMAKARRLAAISNQNVLLDDKLRALYGGEIKTERVVGEGIVGHSISQIRDREEHEKFLRKFTERNR
jgi:hypothetical protein